MKKFSFLLTAIIFCGICNSVLALRVGPPTFCGYDHIVLNSQSKVDSFAMCPNLVSVPILTISGANIHDLTPLSNLKHVAILNISGNAMLESLNGLQNLTSLTSELNIVGNPLLESIDSLKNLSVNGLYQLKITNNPNLLSLYGLQGIKSATWLEIGYNHSLQDLHGLEGITQAGTVLMISNNNGLQSLDGLNSFTHAGNISIKNNPNLTSIAALSQLNDVSNNLSINNLPSLTSLAGLENLSHAATVNIDGNANLTECCGIYPYLGTLTSFGIPNINSVSIANNAQGCNSYLNVVTSCINCNADMVLQSQAEVDAFPGCDTVWGNILIRGSGITNLSALNSLKVVNGNLSIVNAHSLTTLAGLENLETTGELYIFTNANLQSIAALSNLSQAQPLKIINNPKLKLCCGVYPLLTDNPPATVLISGNDVGCKTQQEIITVCTPPTPQFVDLELSMVAPISAPIYTSYPITVKIKNVGTLPASGIKVKFAKPNGVVYTGGNEATATQGTFNPFGDEVWNVGSISAGGTATITVSYFLLQNTLPVAYAQVTAMGQMDIDSSPNNGTPPTPNEDDEVSSAAAQPPPVQPDLTLSNLTAPATLSPGLSNFTFTLQNIGTGAVQGSYQIGSFLSTDNVLSVDDYAFATLSEQNTTVGSFARTGSLDLPSGFTPGNYFLIVKVDVGSAIAEGNENNNTVSSQVTVTGAVCIGDIVLTSQAAINAFSGCSVIDGDLFINPPLGETTSDITDLSPLLSITAVNGTIILNSNRILTNLHGLENISAADGLVVTNCDLLENLNELTNLESELEDIFIMTNLGLLNLNGLEGIKATNGYFIISDNNSLQNLDALSNQVVAGKIEIYNNGSLHNIQGLANLTSVQDNFILSNCDALENLNGLQNLASVGGFAISDNALLQDIGALSSLTNVSGFFSIANNPMLSDCCILTDLLNGNTIGGTISISNNLPGCNSMPEIITECNPVGGSIDLSLTVSSPATAPIYTSYPVTIKVTNSGNIHATGVKVVCQKPNGVVYTGGNEYTATQGSFGTFTNQEWSVGTLAPGAMAMLTVNYFLLQGNLPLVYAQVTAANQSDPDSTPNNGTPPIPNEDDEDSSPVAPPPPAQPDLTLSDLVAPTTIGLGTGNFTFTLKNIGTTAVQGNYQIGSFLSTDNVLSANDYAFATIPESNTAVGSYSRTGSFLLPVGFAPGNYYLIVKVDVGSAVAESNENNNTVSSPVTIPGVSCDGNYVLTTQAQVDAFPSCPVVNGNLRISGADIVDLTPLAGLTNVTGLFEVINNATLPSLQGLNNIANVGGLMVANNPLLTSLAPLSNLHHDAILPLTIDNNPLLTDLNGLQGITGANYLRINGNIGLQTVTGLNNLAIVRGELLVTNNNALQNFNALTKLVSIQSNLIMDENPLLASLNGLSNLKTIGGILFVQGTNSLLDLQGLHNLTSLFGLDVKDNTLLQNLDAMSGITFLNSLRVRNNAVLSDCCGLYPVLSANGVSGVIDIQGNPNGCNSKLDIINNCASQGVDLQLTMTSTIPNPPIYTNFPVKLTITNTGGQAATGVKVHFPRPTGVVYVGGNEFTMTQGGFNAFGNEQWFVGNLAAGASASLTVNYFLLTSNALHPYAQVVGCDQADSDSSPSNGTSPNPVEDDEATIAINGFAGGNSGTSIAKKDNRQRLDIDWVYPNPARYEVNLVVYSPEDQHAVLDFYDQQGRAVYSLKKELKTGTNSIQVFVFDWKSGTYNVIVRGEKTGMPAYGRFLKIWEE